MTRNDTTELLIDLIRRTPILAIDVKMAGAQGDLPAIAYQRAVRAWQQEAAEAVAGIPEGISARGRHGTPDPFARTAAASEMMRTASEPASA